MTIIRVFCEGEDVAPNGRRFLMVEKSDDFPIIIEQNWTPELERLVK